LSQKPTELSSFLSVGFWLPASGAPGQNLHNKITVAIFAGDIVKNLSKSFFPKTLDKWLAMPYN
jgi:hypothetical protein